MSKAVMLSIRPKWCEKIAIGEKTVEMRKTRPRLKTPFKCYIYETQGPTDTPWVDEDGHMTFRGRGQVVGEFICDRIDSLVQIGFMGSGEAPRYRIVTDNCEIAEADGLFEATCLSEQEVEAYLAGRSGYGWHISNLMIYQDPRQVTDFRKPCVNDLYCESCAMHNENSERCGNAGLWMRRAPQSWFYVEDL